MKIILDYKKIERLNKYRIMLNEFPTTKLKNILPYLDKTDRVIWRRFIKNVKIWKKITNQLIRNKKFYFQSIDKCKNLNKLEKFYKEYKNIKFLSTLNSKG